MIRNETEHKAALKSLHDDEQFLEAQRDAFQAEGLSGEEIERVLEPTLSFHAQLVEEIDWYNRVRRREFDVVRNLGGMGRLLIALRIANGTTQRELADRLGISETQVSRDERNEYHGMTLDRAQKVLDALQETLNTNVQERELETASDRKQT